MTAIVTLLPYLTADVTLIRQMQKRTGLLICGELKEMAEFLTERVITVTSSMSMIIKKTKCNLYHYYIIYYLLNLGLQEEAPHTHSC